MFKTRTRTITTTSLTVGDYEVELQHQPVDWLDSHCDVVNNKIVASYIVQDDCYRDADDLIGDCMGRIIDAYNSRDSSELYPLMGCTAGGDKDLDTVYERHSAEFERRYTDQVLATVSAEDLLERFDGWSDRHEDDTDLEFICHCIRIDINNNDWSNLEFNDVAEHVLTEMWGEPAYWPGDLDAVLLDVYDHSGQAWSISGGGTQCRWDTSSGAGAWVPDDNLRKELDIAQEQYCWAYICRTPYLRGKGKKYQLKQVNWTSERECETVSVAFSDDYQELMAARGNILVAAPKPTPVQLRWGRRKACEEYASEFLDQYNEVVCGNVFGIVTEVFDLEGDRLHEDSCWGYVGTEYAEEICKENFDYYCGRAASGETI